MLRLSRNVEGITTQSTEDTETNPSALCGLCALCGEKRDRTGASLARLLTVTDERQRLLEILKRHGWNATSFQVLEDDFAYWFGDDDSAVAYFDTGRAWVVAGSPIAAPERLGEVTAQFLRVAQERGRRVAFFAVEPRFLDATNMPSVRIGEQPSWDPRAWGDAHRGHRSFKEQLRRARARGVAVERVDPAIAAGPLRPDLEALIARWLGSRVMPPMRFLVALDPFPLAEERRYYVARSEEKVAGMLVAVPVYDRGGWFFEDILRDPRSPNGTAETLIDAAMRDVAEDGCTYVTLGLAPLAGNARWLQFARKTMRGFYDFEGLHTFKAKLRPDSWLPISLAWPPERSAAGATYDALDAFAGGRLPQFVVRSIFRAPAPVLLLLGALLVPWTLLLATVETEQWFPSRSVQRLWVVFDLLMTCALLSLARRWRRELALTTCIAATCDGVLTIAQAARHNVRKARRLHDVLIITAAIAAPFVAAAILCGGLRARGMQK